LENLYSIEYMEIHIHRKTEKGATKGTSLKNSMDAKELQEIRGNLK
jgi:hypothetical protein